MQTEFARLRQKSGLSFEALESELGMSASTLRQYETGSSLPKPPVLESMQRMACAVSEVKAGPHPFRFIDLFAGIGGLRRGFDAMGGRCLFTCEWDKFAQRTYAANFHDGDEHVSAGDIRAVPLDQIPEHDVLLGGFPCQPFSIAGVSKKNSLGRAHGFKCAAQGTLFFEVAKIIEHHRPKAFLLENVKNLISHDKGNTFRVIHRTLTEELGYHVQWRVIDAKSFVPQHRERIFMVGFKDATDFRMDTLPVPDVQQGPRLKSILHPEDGSEAPDEPYTMGSKAQVNPKYTLTDNLWKYLQDYAAGHKLKGNGFGFGLSTPDDVARTLSARYYKDGSEILIQQKRKKNPRRLTPRECARLMGFDQPGKPEFKIPVSDMQAYKQFGNAVVAPVVEAVARHMVPYLNATSSGPRPAAFPVTRSRVRTFDFTGD